MSDSSIKSASHKTTNEVMFGLITSRIDASSSVLDFGAGHGHMCQRLGEFFERTGADPKKHLVACEITPEVFRYEKVECRKIGVNSEIPFAAESLSLIYAIEVLEHTFRPYDFFNEAYSKLRPGGWLLFSVPNSLHFKSRLLFLLTGFAEMFGPPSTDVKNAGRICGHIMPLNYAYFVYGLKRLGFVDVQFHKDRSKRSSYGLALMFYPILRLASAWYDRRLKAYDHEVWLENRSVVNRVNRLDMLSSRSCIVVARKPCR